MAQKDRKERGKRRHRKKKELKEIERDRERLKFIINSERLEKEKYTKRKVTLK